MNDNLKLKPEDIEKLPENFQKGLQDGSVVALEVDPPSMSNRLFTITAALLVGAMLGPIWIPVNLLMHEVGLIAALGWCFLYWQETKRSSEHKMYAKIHQAVAQRLLHILEKAGNLDGTNDDKNGLSKDLNDGTHKVH